MIQLERLRGFYWVARSEGYARAARAFPYPITEPGIHQQVKRLEHEIGVRLFERVGKDRMQLTPAGQALFKVVEPFLDQLPALEAVLKRGTYGGTLRVHAAGMFVREILPRWLRRLQDKRPDIEIALSEIRVADLGLLRTGEADLLVDTLDEIPDDIEVRHVADVNTFLVLPSNHPLAHRKRLSLAGLGDFPFITYNGNPRARSLQLLALERLGHRPRRLHSADSADSIVAFVAAGLGFSLVPSLAPAGPRRSGIVARPLNMPEARFAVHAAWRKRAIAHPLIAAALEWAPASDSVAIERV